MATAIPLPVAVITEPTTLSPGDARWLRSFAAFCEAEEAREPGLIDREIEASRSYGNDFARELADIEAARHPLQKSR